MKRLRYSQSELHILNKVAESKQVLNEELLKSISARIKRPISSIQQYIYKQRKKFGYSSRTSSKISEGIGEFRQGEFVIPVRDWEVRNESGSTLLVLKFNKTN
jgi:hypothetical protein